MKVNTKGYVYLIHGGAKYYKIGMTTKHPEERLAQLQTGNPNKLELSAYAFVNNALELEQQLHGKFSHASQEGEWFELSKSDVEIIHNTYEDKSIVKDDLLAPLSEEGAKRLAEERAKAKTEAEERAKAKAIRKRSAERLEKLKAERRAEVKREAIARRKAELKAHAEKIARAEARLKAKEKAKKETKREPIDLTIGDISFLTAVAAMVIGTIILAVQTIADYLI